MSTALAKELEDLPIGQLLELTEALYKHVRATVIAGTANQEDIRACNMARKEINECKKQGV